MTITTSKQSPSSETHRTLVLDTSVVLNLLACEAPARLLEALGGTFVVPRQVIDEIVREPQGTREPNNTLSGLLGSAHLLMHKLEGVHLEAFIDLAAALPPDGLDDGEAAAIATAEELGCGCVIDERKATRIAQERRPQSTIICTVDLFLEAKQRELFEPADLRDLVFGALTRARMRVPDHHGEWVVDLIGTERAGTCATLTKIMRKRTFVR